MCRKGFTSLFYNTKIGLTFWGKFLHNQHPRVWRQLSRELKNKFDLFKYSEEVEENIYNYGGKEIQKETLQSLRSIREVEGQQIPEEEPQAVEIIAFKGDTLLELAKYACGDVALEGFENVGGLNLYASKSAQVCNSQAKELSTGIDPHREFEGGEAICFYNCAALGYAPIIGQGTLLDNVVSGDLSIRRVLGGVSAPIVEARIFEYVDGEYREIETRNTESHEGTDWT
ncbi:MAG: hypothetical protein AB4372_29975 [Xenococcus sp. (in: cyanobacteria)]